MSTISCFGRIDKDVCFLHSFLSQYIIGDSQGKFVLFIKFKLKRRLDKESLLICVFTFFLVFYSSFKVHQRDFFFFLTNCFLPIKSVAMCLIFSLYVLCPLSDLSSPTGIIYLDFSVRLVKG